MESIPGYDRWKTALPDEQEPVMYCDICGEPICEGDYVTEVQGEKWCDNCLNSQLRKVVEE